MLLRYVGLALAVFVICLLSSLCSASQARADPAPQPQAQPHQDLFPNTPDSPLSAKVINTGIVLWTLKIGSGCQGPIAFWGNTIASAMGDLYNKTDIRSVYVTDGSQDLILRVECGLTFQSRCGTGAAACLGEGFPTNNNITFTDQMYTGGWTVIGNTAIACHEYCGHALAKLHEQYCLQTDVGVIPGCTAWGQMVPGWYDQMNTGELSRHYLDDNELNRLGRVLGAPAPANGMYGLTGQYLYICGSLPRATGIWVDGYGAAPISTFATYGPNQCRYLDVAGQHVCFDIGNAVDWKDGRLRSDRCVQ